MPGYFLQEVLNIRHLADNLTSYDAGLVRCLGQLTVWLQFASWAASQMTEILSADIVDFSPLFHLV